MRCVLSHSFNLLVLQIPQRIGQTLDEADSLFTSESVDAFRCAIHDNDFAGLERCFDDFAVQQIEEFLSNRCTEKTGIDH